MQQAPCRTISPSNPAEASSCKTFCPSALSSSRPPPSSPSCPGRPASTERAPRNGERMQERRRRSAQGPGRCRHGIRKRTAFAHEQDLTKVPDMSRPPLMPEGTPNRVKLLKATPAPDPFLKNKKQFRQRSLSRNLLLRESRQRNPAFLRPYPGSGAPSAPCRREQHRSRREGRR